MLAIMILPTVAATSQDALRQVPYRVKEAFHGEDVYGPKIDPVVLRRYIGMVFRLPVLRHRVAEFLRAHADGRFLLPTAPGHV